MSEIILVQPKAGYLEFISSRPVAPVALLSIARKLYKDYPIRLIDQRVDENWQENLADALNKTPICLGLTSFTGNQLGFMLEIAKYVKSRYKEIPVILGGIHASILPEQTLENPNIDFVLQGEGDLAFPKFIEALAGKISFGEVEGLFFHDNGSIVNPTPTKAVQDMDDLPHLPYQIIDVKNYITIDKKGKKRLDIQTSRGCPYHCIFCYQTKIRRNWRAFSAERTLEHIMFLIERHDIQHFRIFDDNFFVDLKRSFEIIRGFEERKLDIRYKIDGCRIPDLDKMDNEMLRTLERTGCSELQIGIEAGSDKMLKVLKKGTNLEQIKRVADKMKKYNIWLYYEFLCGHPQETYEDLKKTTDLALKLAKENPNAFISPLDCLTPYPGSELFDLYINSGYKPPVALKEWAKWQWDNFSIPWLKDDVRKKLLLLNILTVFISKKTKISNSKIIHFLFGLYRGIARFRLKHHFVKFPVELKIFDYILKSDFSFYI